MKTRSTAMLVTLPASGEPSRDARAAGIADRLPQWVVPIARDVLEQRSLAMRPWMPAILLAIFTMVIGRIDNMVLGYGLFRLTSDIAAIDAQLKSANLTTAERTRLEFRRERLATARQQAVLERRTTINRARFATVSLGLTTQIRTQRSRFRLADDELHER